MLVASLVAEISSSPQAGAPSAPRIPDNLNVFLLFVFLKNRIKIPPQEGKKKDIYINPPHTENDFF